MAKLDAFINPLIRWAELLAKACVVLLFTSVFSSVVLRYLFSTGSTKLEDLQHYTFGSLLLLSVAIAFASGRHVKVEILQFEAHAVSKRGFLVLWLMLLVCLPMGFIVVLSIPEILHSWRTLDGSSELDGLGGLFLVKTFLPITGILIFLIAVGRAISPADREL
ncbi:MAG: TRAP transporter small permease subunit [Pseudomonadota bacterium]